MKKNTVYDSSIRDAALAKVFARGSRSICEVADELGINFYTLKKWMSQSKQIGKQGATPGKPSRPGDLSAAQRFDLIVSSQHLSGEKLSAFCRKNGLFEHSLEQWREAFVNGVGTGATDNITRDLKQQNKALKRELNRKEKALAEAAALLVLSKKLEALWDQKDD